MTASRISSAVGVAGKARQAARDRFERGEGEDHLDGDAEIGGDVHRELEAGLIVAALEEADRLRVYPDGIGQLAAGDAAIGSKQSDPVVHVALLRDLLRKHNI